jgi:uncharacterized protein YcaQ
MGKDFIGRIEFAHYKKNKPLEIIGLWYEPGIKQTKTLQKKMDRCIKEFASYVGATTVIWP